MKRSLKEIIDGYEVLEVHKEAGTVFTPRDVMEYLVGKVSNESDETLERLWYQTGRWYGIYLRERFDDSIEAFVRLLREGRCERCDHEPEPRNTRVQMCLTVPFTRENPTHSEVHGGCYEFAGLQNTGARMLQRYYTHEVLSLKSLYTSTPSHTSIEWSQSHCRAAFLACVIPNRSKLLNCAENTSQSSIRLKIADYCRE